MVIIAVINLEFSDKINQEMRDIYVKVEAFNSGHIIAICTPLTKRTHRHMQESDELVFVDSSGGLDRDGYRVLMTHSKAGGVFFAFYFMKLFSMIVETAETKASLTDRLLV